MKDFSRIQPVSLSGYLDKSISIDSEMVNQHLFNVSVTEETLHHCPWLCDFECESDGIDVYILYLKEDKDLKWV